MKPAGRRLGFRLDRPIGAVWATAATVNTPTDIGATPELALIPYAVQLLT